MARARQAIIALGSNLGDRQENLDRALEHLEQSECIQKVIPSPVYETAPVGLTEQPPFLNMVAGVETTLSPEEVLELLLQTERQMGRVRTARWGPRLIDLDLLFYEEEERHLPGLDLPHPRWAERSFVTVPLRDLLNHPAFAGSPWQTLRARLRELPPDEGVQPFAGK